MLNCSRCGKVLKEEDAYSNQGKPICDDCLMDIGLSPHGCDPWAEYVENADRVRHGKTGTAGLSDVETDIYNFIKAKGKATRKDVAASLGFSEDRLAEHLTALLHGELVKDVSDGSTQFLEVIG